MRRLLILSACLALVLTAIACFLGRRHAGSVNTAGQAPQPRLLDLEVGDKLCRPDGRPWPKTQRTVVIVVSATCGACSSSEPLHNMLYTRCQRLNIPVLYVLPDRADQDKRSRDLLHLGRAVIRANLAALGVSRVPSLLAVDSVGTIKALRTGTIPAESVDRVMTDLTTGIGSPLYARATRKELDQRVNRDTAPVQLLAFSGERMPPRPGIEHKVIPVSELSPRAKYELEPDKPVFVDCATAPSPYSCQGALITLAMDEFTRLVAVNLPQRGNAGGCTQ